MKGKPKKIEQKIGDAGKVSIEITDDLTIKGELSAGAEVDLVKVLRESGNEMLKKAGDYLGALVGR